MLVQNHVGLQKVLMMLTSKDLSYTSPHVVKGNFTAIEDEPIFGATSFIHGNVNRNYHQHASTNWNHLNVRLQCLWSNDTHRNFNAGFCDNNITPCAFLRGKVICLSVCPSLWWYKHYNQTNRGTVILRVAQCWCKGTLLVEGMH